MLVLILEQPRYRGWVSSSLGERINCKAILLPHSAHERLPFRRVDSLCQKCQRLAVWIQTLYKRRGTHCVFKPARTAMVRIAFLDVIIRLVLIAERLQVVN